MSVMIPSCNADAYMKFQKKNFATYAKNATVKNIITINKYNVGMKSLDRAIVVSDTLKTEMSPSFISQVRVWVRVPFPFPASVLDSGFSIRPLQSHIPVWQIEINYHHDQQRFNCDSVILTGRKTRPTVSAPKVEGKWMGS